MVLKSVLKGMKPYKSLKIDKIKFLINFLYSIKKYKDLYQKDDTADTINN